MIPELYTEQQVELRDRARKVAEEAMRPVAAKYDEAQEYPWEVQEAIKEAGLSGVWIPEEYGGLGGAVLGRLSRGRGVLSGVRRDGRRLRGECARVVPHSSSAAPEEQKQRWLPRHRVRREADCLRALGEGSRLRCRIDENPRRPSTATST